MRMAAVLAAVLAMGSILLSCDQSGPKTQAVYILVDRTGIYAHSFENIRMTARVLLSKLSPGDSMAIARIDNELFSSQDIIAAVTFSSRPSNANKQKRALFNAVDKLANEQKVGSYTDVTGGLLKATEWLNATRASKKIIIIFSEFPDEPRIGYMQAFPVNYNGANVLVWNAIAPLADEGVTLTESRSFAERVSAWKARVNNDGGKWQVINNVADVITALN